MQRSLLSLLYIKTLHFLLVLLYTVETVRLTIYVRLLLILCILLLGLGKGNYHIILTVGLPYMYILSNLCNIVVQQFYGSQEVLRIPIQAHCVVVLNFSLDFLYFKLSDPLRNRYVIHLSLDWMFTSIFCYLFTVSLEILCFSCSKTVADTG